MFYMFVKFTILLFILSFPIVKKKFEIYFNMTSLASQSGDPFVLLLFKCFHDTFTRCARFNALFV